MVRCARRNRPFGGESDSFLVVAVRVSIETAAQATREAFPFPRWGRVQTALRAPRVANAELGV